MTEISGNLGVNTKFNQNEHKQPKETSEVSEKKNIEEKDTNLNESMDAISGRSLVKASKAGEVKEPYKFNADCVEDDVLAFQAATDVAKDYYKELVEAGYDSTAAADKAFQFASCLMSHENV